MSFVKVLFLFMVFLTPLGILAAIGLVMQARNAAASSDGAKAILLRGQAAERLLYSLASGVMGLIGYWLVTRNIIPQLEPAWILILLFGVLFLIHFFIRRKLKLPKWKDWF
jgi:hypothetical protein